MRTAPTPPPHTHTQTLTQRHPRRRRHARRSNYVGNVSWVYVIEDSLVPGATPNATVTLIIAPPGTLGPANYTYEAEFDVPFTPDLSELLLRDINSSNPRKALEVVDVLTQPPPAAGVVETFPNGSFVFTPTRGWYGTTEFCVNVTDGSGQYTKACAVIVIDPKFPATCRCAPYSAGPLQEWVSTTCASPPFDFTGFLRSQACSADVIANASQPLGCWLADDANWAKLVQANRFKGETTRLALRSGEFTARFTKGGLFCLATWFDLSKNYESSLLRENVVVDGTPGACSEAPPDLARIGGGNMLAVVATTLNLLRDVVLNQGVRGHARGVLACVPGGFFGEQRALHARVRPIPANALTPPGRPLAIPRGRRVPPHRRA